LRIRMTWPVALRAALLIVFAAVVAVSIGCNTSGNNKCTNGDWQCDASHKEIDQCVNGEWKFVELCVGAYNFCRSGQGYDCHGPNTACCEVLPN
jgi:hypothetical protein